MPAAKLDIYIEQGASFKRKLTFKDSENTPIDLTGNTFEGKVKKNISDSAAVATFTITVLDQITNTGEVMVELTATQTSAIALKSQRTPTRSTEKFCYDIERTLPDLRKERVLEGIAEVSPEVTK
jgi:hypothetical protein